MFVSAPPSAQASPIRCASPPERVRAAYARRPAFVALLRRHDPAGTLRNAFLDDYVFGPD